MLAPVQYLWALSPDCQLCQPHTQPSVGMDDRRYVRTYLHINVTSKGNQLCQVGLLRSLTIKSCTALCTPPCSAVSATFAADPLPTRQLSATEESLSTKTEWEKGEGRESGVLGGAVLSARGVELRGLSRVTLSSSLQFLGVDCNGSSLIGSWVDSVLS